MFWRLELVAGYWGYFDRSVNRWVSRSNGSGRCIGLLRLLTLGSAHVIPSWFQKHGK
jgi:hypothetical protein